MTPAKRSKKARTDKSLPALTAEDWETRTVAYRHFASLAAPPTVRILRKRLQRDHDAVVESLKRLHEHHHLVLFPEKDEIWMAHPFSASPTSYRVQTPQGRHWANCAWDALGIPAAMGTDGWTETRGPQTPESLSFGVRDGKLVGDECIVHVAVPLAQFWDDIGLTCSTIHAFQSEEDLDAWCEETEHPRGYVMSMEQTWELAQLWYAGRLEPEWRGRTQAETRRILKAVGLKGDFWKLG